MRAQINQVRAQINELSIEVKKRGPRTDCIGAVCSGSTLFASVLNLSVMLGNYLQQTTSANDIFTFFRCIFFSWRFKGKTGFTVVQRK